jgi:hypothetical protein
MAGAGGIGGGGGAGTVGGSGSGAGLGGSFGVADSASDVGVGVGGGDPGPRPQGTSGSGCGSGGVTQEGGGNDAALLLGYLQDAEGADPTGGVSCSTPSDCSTKCFAASKYCVEHAVHPYKPPMVGDLFQCIDSIPPASLGGSYTCLYRYPNEDACIFSRAAKFGPITPPAPPPLCVYKSQ